MAKDTQLSNAAVNAQAAALADLLDNGYRRIYSGTKPADADTALSGNTLLAELRFANPSESSITNGVITFAGFTADADADATGTASFYRDFKADGTTVVMDGTCGVGSGYNMNMPTTSIVQHVQVQVTSATHDVKKSTSGL